MKSWMNRARVRLDAFDKKWGSVVQLILGTAIVCVCIALVVLALEIRAQGQETDQRAAETQKRSREACKRTRKFGPTLAVQYAKNGWLSPEQVEAYLATIPDKC